MADLGNYSDKLMQDDEEQNRQMSNITPTAGTSGVVSGGTGSVGGPSTAGVGAGGTGGWTNIQAYLGANKTDNGSSKLLENKAGTQYANENTALQTQAGEKKTQAENEANKINEAKDKSKEWVNQAANAYSWSGNQNSDYGNNVQKLRGAMNDKYAGPENFTYQKSADFQRTNTALGEDRAFKGYMNDIYRDKAGGQLSSGMGSLQTQLDVNNQNLADARKNLLTQYAGFDNTMKDTVDNTDAAILKAKTDYGNNQQGLKTHLDNMGNDYQMQIDKAEADARAGYNTSLNSDKSGHAAAGYDYYGGNNEVRSNADAWGDDLTYRQIENQNKFFENNAPARTMLDIARKNPSVDNDSSIAWRNQASSLDQANNLLNDFYSAQDEKYGNTADSEEKNWNTIMDVLGKTDRKQQGFKVRNNK